MKHFLMSLIALSILLFSACNKDAGNSKSEVGDYIVQKYGLKAIDASAVPAGCTVRKFSSIAEADTFFARISRPIKITNLEKSGENKVGFNNQVKSNLKSSGGGPILDWDYTESYYGNITWVKDDVTGKYTSITFDISSLIGMQISDLVYETQVVGGVYEIMIIGRFYATGYYSDEYGNTYYNNTRRADFYFMTGTTTNIAGGVFYVEYDGVGFGPYVSPGIINSIKTNSAIYNSSVEQNEYSSVVSGVCYSTLPYPTIADNHIASNVINGSYALTLSSLSPNTTYYARAYVTYYDGTYYSQDRVFKTAALTTDALVSSYKFNTDMLDYSGYVNNLTSYNSASISGGSLVLNGTGAYCKAANSTSLNPTKISVCARVQLSEFVGVGNDAIIDKPYTSHVAPYYQYHLGANGNRGATAAQHIFGFNLTINGTLVGVATSTSSWHWIPGVWYTVVGTYDGSTMKIYVNGTLMGSQTIVGVISGYSTDMCIGKFGNSANYLPGNIDWVKIYNYALTSTEVAALAE